MLLLREDMLFEKGISSPTGNPKWTRAAVDKLLANKKYIPIVGVNGHIDAQFEKDRRCNVDYDKAGHLRKPARYQSPLCRNGIKLYKSCPF